MAENLFNFFRCLRRGYLSGGRIDPGAVKKIDSFGVSADRLVGLHLGLDKRGPLKLFFNYHPVYRWEEWR